MLLERAPEWIAAAVVGAIVATAALLGILPKPAPGPAIVSVDTLYMEHERPELAHPSLGQKLTTRSVKPEQLRVASAPSAPGRLAVASYCAPSIATPDRTTSHHSAPPSILPDFRGERAGARLSLYSTLGDGRRWAADYRARGRIRWESSGDTVLVRGDRLWTRVARGAPKCLAWGSAGALLGGLLAGRDGAAAAGGIGLAACAL